MAKKMLIDATHPEETRVVVVDGNKVEEFDFETVNKRQLAGNIYLAKVTRVEPSLQAAFVDYGGNRHGFLAFAEIHPDYYQIPVADRRALLEEERAAHRAEADEENGRRRKPSRKPAPKAESRTSDAVTSTEIGAMDVVDLGEETGADSLFSGEAPDLVDEIVDGVIVRPEPDDAVVQAEPVEATDSESGDEHYHAVDHAADIDDEIESVAEEDVAEEIPEPRRQRPKKYKIQEVIKVRQIMLVQVVKEERGNKGAALTTYLSLAGRYCVLMPNTARGGGISRKITNAVDRKKLKEIAGEIEVPEGAGLIIRTAGAKRTKAEIKRDYEYLCRLWEQIRDLTFQSHAPAPIYEEGDLIKRSIRDLYTREIEEVLVEGATGYRTAKDFMRMIMPSQAGAVQPYVDTQPLFARYQVESYLAGMFNPVVQLKSGGYIVIGVTEALVAIDVNSGRATKEGSIEDTALKTNLEAADEIARQLRLRDLAGLIVIDFIDMEERKNNAAVEKRLKDKLKTDRARIQVGRISGFGLLEMSRQRLRPGMLESTTQPCPHCHGTGLIRSDDSLALAILRALEEEGTRKRSKEVLVKAPIGIVNYLFNHKREHIAQIEIRYGMAVRMEADPALISPDYVIEKFKTATRVVAPAAPVVSLDATAMPELEEEPLEIEEEIEEEAEVAEVAEAPATDAKEDAQGNGKKKRRRRRRRRGGASSEANGAGDAAGDDEGDEAEGDEAEGDVEEVTEAVVEAAPEPVVLIAAAEAAPAAEVVTSEPIEPAPAAEVVDAPVEEAPAKPKATRSRSKTAKPSTAKPRATKSKAAAEVSETAAPEAPAAEEDAAPAKKPTRKRSTSTTSSRSRSKAKATEETPVEAAPADLVAAEPAPVEAAPVAEAAPVVEDVPAAEPAPVAAPAAAEAGPESAPEETSGDGEPKPRRRGWWSAR
ncbi:Rne/Rng family ribonuclease [Gemmobacter nectariphilus]|uniref:Rne/Rng family ribonuclease n=1 Tax=Gemmobacter nectariphilus TaxID=220343 RepID=UPI00040AF8F4|nr:ribonuclease E/G [Gemmobacter nectariphilus]